MYHYNIYFIPFEIRGPIYLELLKANINGKAGDGSTFTVNPFSWKHLFFTRPVKNERRVIHIHWESNVYGSKNLLVSFGKMILKFPALFLLKMMGNKIIWTMHNLKSHDYPHPKSDEFGRTVMWALAQKVLLHEKSFAVEQQNKRKNKDIECIPPGNYINAYGPLWQGDKVTLRKEYGLDPNAIVLLALGAVRPYKVLEPIIEAVKEVSKKFPLQLLIIGRATPEYGEKLKQLADGDKSIVFNLNYFDDADTPKIHAVADYSALYYGESAIGSAAILLSLSYGVPVISRNFAVSELVQVGVNGFKFENKNDLIKILEKLPQVPKFDPKVVLDTVADWGWKDMGEATRKAYISLYK